MKTFTYYNDPGHGWLKVDWTELKRLGLNPTDFSRCSYRRRNTFYLEEDCDAPKFIEAWEANNGTKIKLAERHANNSSRIRNYDPIY
jgi:hypothetical protein